MWCPCPNEETALALARQLVEEGLDAGGLFGNWQVAASYQCVGGEIFPVADRCIRRVRRRLRLRGGQQ